ncbi:MAG: hypothetical protein PVJ28_00200 [Acidimicrobiia bacterium]|jgi:hypothetical protein
MDGLGRVFNVIKTASGLDIPLTRAQAVTFVFGDAGTGAAIATVTQTDSTGTNSEADLNVFTVDGTAGSNGVSTLYVGPDVGGTWTALAATADNTADLSDDTTNDTGVFTVSAPQLSDGYDQVQVTVDTGLCTAIVHDLKEKRSPANLKSSIVA